MTKPNIVAIMADDVGIWNLSAYHQGMMGVSTPNIELRGDEITTACWRITPRLS
jgi:arylsulfatase A-like enzyme